MICGNFICTLYNILLYFQEEWLDTSVDNIAQTYEGDWEGTERGRIEDNENNIEEEGLLNVRF